MSQDMKVELTLTLRQVPGCSKSPREVQNISFLCERGTQKPKTHNGHTKLWFDIWTKLVFVRSCSVYCSANSQLITNHYCALDCTLCTPLLQAQGTLYATMISLEEQQGRTATRCIWTICPCHAWQRFYKTASSGTSSTIVFRNHKIISWTFHCSC